VFLNSKILTPALLIFGASNGRAHAQPANFARGPYAYYREARRVLREPDGPTFGRSTLGVSAYLGFANCL